MSQSPAQAVPLSFTLAQHATIQEWAMPRPYGLRVEIATDMEVADEVACVSHRHVSAPLFLITPLEAGRVVVCASIQGVFGVTRQDEWEEDTVEDALAAVIEWERDLDEAG